MTVDFAAVRFILFKIGCINAWVFMSQFSPVSSVAPHPSDRVSYCFCLLCPVSATMKRRSEATSAPLQGTKRRRDDSSSDEESQLSRQGRVISPHQTMSVKSDIFIGLVD